MSSIMQFKNLSWNDGGVEPRVLGDKSIMSKRPDCSKVVKTEKQKANMKRFAAATVYGKKVLNDPKLREKFNKKKKKYQSTWNAAISDFMTKPKVNTIDLKGYRELPSNESRISARNRFKFEAVIVTILNIFGVVVEIGPAVVRPSSEGMEWGYKAGVMNPTYKGCRVVVRVSGLPGNRERRVLLLIARRTVVTQL